MEWLEILKAGLRGLLRREEVLEDIEEGDAPSCRDGD
jgi:hypothetical protein